MATAAGTTSKWSRQRSLSWRRIGRGAVPYGLIFPVVAVLAAILGYPIYSLIRLSLQKYGLFELIQHKGHYIGLHNFGLVLHDPVFWHTAVRTIVFAAVNVALTLVLGTSVNERAAARSWFVPAAKHWVDVENGNILRTMLSEILGGKFTVKQAATLASDNITATLNQS